MRYRRLWGWGLAFGLLLLAGGLGTGYFARLALGFQFQDPASVMRLAEYSNALDIIGRYPLFGVGFGTAGELDPHHRGVKRIPDHSRAGWAGHTGTLPGGSSGVLL